MLVEDRGRPVDEVDALAGQQGTDLRLQPVLDRAQAQREVFEIDFRADLVEPHTSRPAQELAGVAGGDHGLRRDAVVEVGGTADHVALDERHFRAEAGGRGGT